MQKSELKNVVGNYFSSADLVQYTRARDPMIDDSKLQSQADYLNGRTPRCRGYNMPEVHGCGRRVSTMKAPLCDQCEEARCRDDFKTEFAKPSDKWYMVWTHFGNTYKTFVCRTCGDQQDAKNIGIVNEAGELVPAAACCTMIETCKSARDFWGDDGGRVRRKVDAYVRHSGKSPYLKP